MIDTESEYWKNLSSDKKIDRLADFFIGLEGKFLWMQGSIIRLEEKLLLQKQKEKTQNDN